MAQPIYVLEYLGAETFKKNNVVQTSLIAIKYPTANMFKMKTQNVKVSIDGTDMFLTTYDDESYITGSKTFIFDTDCTIAIGKYVTIA